MFPTFRHDDGLDKSPASWLRLSLGLLTGRWLGLWLAWSELALAWHMASVLLSPQCVLLMTLSVGSYRVGPDNARTRKHACTTRVAGLAHASGVWGLNPAMLLHLCRTNCDTSVRILTRLDHRLNNTWHWSGLDAQLWLSLNRQDSLI